ncbi:MAG: YggS family pyridoxal phosphate-dependent enzyme [Saprospiraceae bacterium]|nr:YggS family pyridoxal phosphate-dependent enzyme [Saprospiraceae bacterium]
MELLIAQILQELKPFNARLVAVSKTKPVGDIRKIYDLGQRIFGENRVQELMAKVDLLPEDIEWHLIGHLQRNKVKYIAPFIGMIHSVDSLELAKEINKQAARNDRRIPVLLQIRIAEEETKFGIETNKIDQFVEEMLAKNWHHLEIAGVMGMASFVDDEKQISAEFNRLKEIFDHLKSRYFEEETSFREISMGMSGDYQIALQQGSTMVRIGSLIFGARN